MTAVPQTACDGDGVAGPELITRLRAQLRPQFAGPVILADPASISAHSAARCQCSSRMPPASSRMFTPEIELAIWKSDWVTCRAQPPS